MMRARLRDLGVTIGDLPTGTYNAITDVPGVTVGHTTLIYDEPRVARTGVTIIHPRAEATWDNNCFAGYHSFNGNGEMTGIAWLEESGMLISSIGITNTHQVGFVRDTLVADATANGYRAGFLLPVVAETYDGWLNDIDAFHVTRDHVYEAIASAKGGAVAEGSVGGGTGMICHEFKGGIGTSSRIVEVAGEQYTVGVLVQTNYGWRQNLRVDGVPVGREITPQHTPRPRDFVANAGSIIVVIATDAPLIPTQCKRLAQRATVGLARVGGVGHNGSGDLFIAFSTGNDLKSTEHPIQPVEMLLHQHLNPFFDAVADATEESILNALTAAETMVGFQGRIVHALPLDELQRVMKKFRVPG
jgi:D-aminopeptidase